MKDYNFFELFRGTVKFSPNKILMGINCYEWTLWENIFWWCPKFVNLQKFLLLLKY